MMADTCELWPKITELFWWIIHALSLLGSEFWSAIVGAAVGGVIAYVIQRQEREASRKDRDNDRKLEAKSQGYSLLFKVMSIHSNFTNLKTHVDERMALYKKVKADRISSVLLAIVNLPAPVEFAPTEMAMLLSLEDDDVFNAIYSLDQIHNSILPAWTMYEAKRSAIGVQGESLAFDASDGKGEFSYRKGSALEVLLFEVEAMAKDLVERSQRDFDEAQAALNTLIPLLNSKLGLGVKITPKQ